MVRYLKINLAGLLVLALSVFAKSTGDTLPTQQFASQIAQADVAASSKQAADRIRAETLPLTAFKAVAWTDLMPKEDLDALLNPPSYITDIEDGSIEDQISSQIQNIVAAASDDRYQQALVSTRVVPEMNGRAIRLPGFIVPLEFDDNQVITEFFLVPFFGACIHVPPPPPNQIIFVNSPEGIKLDALFDPFWISGILKTSQVANDLATAAYTMDMQHLEIYEDPD